MAQAGVAKRTGADRYFYAAMAFVFLASAVVGFAPNSIDILTGDLPNPPLLIHAHAAVMTGWMALLCGQATLASGRRMDLHMRLGALSPVLAGGVLFFMSWIVVRDILSDNFPPPVMVIQAKRLLGFGIAAGLAYRWRRAHPDAHKRLMFLATFIVLDAAFFRMDWYPTDFGLEQPITVAHIYQFALLVPFLVRDAVRDRRVHPVFVVGVPVIAGMQGLAAFLW